ncbi:MAG: DctP family TRAP transporter solute-binding subunit [Candidatus Competibacterales bacterium]
MSRVLCCVLLCLAAVSFGGVAAAQTTLRFGHYAAPEDTAAKAAEHFKTLVEEKTAEAVVISLHPAGELGNSPTMLQGVRLGTIDLTVVGNPYFTSFAPELNLLDLPFLFESPAHAYAVLDGEVGQTLMAGLAKHRMKGLALWEIGFRDITTSDTPVHGPEDLQGLKLRTTPNPAHVKAFEIWGAKATPMPFSEVYLALQTGAVDGQENPINHIYASRLHEVQRHLSITHHAYTASPLVMNLSKFNGLPPEHQEALLAAALEAATFERQLNAELEAASLAAMVEAGVQVVENPDVEAFRSAVAEAVRASYSEQFGDELLRAVDAARSAD